jgi:hypothetical protein
LVGTAREIQQAPRWRTGRYAIESSSRARSRQGPYAEGVTQPSPVAQRTLGLLAQLGLRSLATDAICLASIADIRFDRLGRNQGNRTMNSPGILGAVQ